MATKKTPRSGKRRGAPLSAAKRQGAFIDDLVAASRILARHGVLDAYGHVSARSLDRPDRFLMSRSLAPALVTAADIMELDLDSEPARGESRKRFLECFIHGEIYRARADVMAVVHSHSATVIPFGITTTPLRPVYHMGAFLGSGTPVFEIRNSGGNTDLLVRDRYLGKALAEVLGTCTCVLMRGHGMTVVGGTIPEAVFRAFYTDANARIQLFAQGLGGPINSLNAEEGQLATASIRGTITRPWELWKREVLGN